MGVSSGADGDSERVLGFLLDCSVLLHLPGVFGMSLVSVALVILEC